MESIYTRLALYGSKNLCARTDTVFLPISEVCDGTVSLSPAVIGVYRQFWPISEVLSGDNLATLCLKIQFQYAGLLPQWPSSAMIIIKRYI